MKSRVPEGARLFSSYWSLSSFEFAYAMPEADLLTDKLMLTSRIRTASNAAFMGDIGDTPMVYKPIRGEKPFWDFPDGRLAHQEVAAYLVSKAMGWNIAPRMWLHEGHLNEGKVELWEEPDPEQDAVDLMPVDELPETEWKHVPESQDEPGRTVVLLNKGPLTLR
jgi:uncharacterized repeat protein (TIGR03843 family)